jgi:hypothetical protein
MLDVTSLRNSHRELITLLLVVSSIFVAVGIANAAASTTSTPSHDGTAGVSIQSVP